MKKNNFSLSGKTAIVTGSSRGIGHAIALKLAEHGANIIVHYLKNHKAAQATVDHIDKLGNSKAISLQADIASTKEIHRLFDTTMNTFGQLDILVNNAAIFVDKNLADTSESEFDRFFTTNVKGPFFAMQQAFKIMPEGSHIVNIGSTVINLLVPGYSLYSTTKGALYMLTRASAHEAGQKGITVNMISPGATNTEMLADGVSKDDIKEIKNQTALGRIAEPEDIANAVLLLVSQESSWITAQNIFANGGWR